jgi:uncharacterized protein YjdB
MTAKGGDSLKIKWRKIKGAEGYDIFFSKCGHDGAKDKLKKVKTVKAGKKLAWTKSGLKVKTGYKAFVRAWYMKDGKKTYVRTGPMVHAFTTGSKAKYTNAKSVIVSKSKVTLNKGKTQKISASVKKLVSGKKLMSKHHAPKLRFISSNPKVAAVSSSGKITAKAKGSCSIYALAHNGVYAAIKVTVK